jgi:hypothetical protein
LCAAADNSRISSAGTGLLVRQLTRSFVEATMDSSFNGIEVLISIAILPKVF